MTGLAVVTVVCAAGIVVAALGLDRLGSLRRVVTTKIARTPPGRVRIAGSARAVDDERLAAPLSGRPCLAYAVHVFERAQHRLYLGSTVRALPFDVDDDTGRAHVVADGRLRLEVPPDVATTAEAAALRALGIIVEPAAFGLPRRLDCIEAVLLDGDRLMVRGEADLEISADGTGGSYREPPRRLTLRAPLLVNAPPAPRRRA